MNPSRSTGERRAGRCACTESQKHFPAREKSFFPRAWEIRSRLNPPQRLPREIDASAEGSEALGHRGFNCSRISRPPPFRVVHKTLINHCEAKSSRFQMIFSRWECPRESRCLIDEGPFSRGQQSMGLQPSSLPTPAGLGSGSRRQERLRRVENPPGIHPGHGLGEGLGWKMAFRYRDAPCGCSRMGLDPALEEFGGRTVLPKKKKIKKKSHHGADFTIFWSLTCFCPFEITFHLRIPKF